MQSFKKFIEEANAGEKCSCCDSIIDKDGKCGCGSDCSHCGGSHAVSEAQIDESEINELTAQYINENNISMEQLENMTEEELNELIGKALGGAFKIGAKAAVGAARLAKKGVNRVSASGRADAAEKKADAIEKRNKDRERIRAAKDRVKAAKDAAKPKPTNTNK